MKKNLTFIFALFLGIFAQATPNPLAQKVIDAQSQGTLFSSYLLFGESRVKNEEALTFAPFAQFLTLQKNDLQALLQENPKALTLDFPYHGSLITVDVVVAAVHSDDFVTTNERFEPQAYQQGLHYRGIVRGEEHSIVALSFFDDGIMGMISMPNTGNLVLGRLEERANKTAYILYDDSQVTAKNSFHCDNEEEHVVLNQNLSNQAESSAVNGCIRIYFEGDYDMYVNRGSLTAAVNHMSALFNQMAALYAADNINMLLSQTMVWTSPDSYSDNSSSAGLDAFRVLRAGKFNANIGHVLATPSGGAGGRAFLGVICSSTYNVAYSNLGYSYNVVPTYSWAIMVLAHETGHNLGSPHTQWCGWPGGAIDNCYATEGGCAQGPAPTNGGTIMSYCHVTSYGINFTNRFGPLPLSEMKGDINNAQCLSTCAGSDCQSVNDISIYSINNVSATVNWTGGIAPYTLEYRKVGTSIFIKVPDAKSPHIITGLASNTQYEVAIRSICGTQTVLSTVQVFQTGSSSVACNPPSNLTANTDIGLTSVVLKWAGNSTAALGYTVWWKSSTVSTWTKTPTPIQGTSYTITGLTPKTTYLIRLQSVCSATNESTLFANANATTLACLAPTNLTLMQNSATKVLVKWVAAKGAAKYNVEWKSIRDDNWNEASVSKTEFEINDLDSTALNEIKVKTDCGTYSSANTLLGKICQAPINFKIVSTSPTQLQLTWKTMEGGTTYRISHRIAGATNWSAEASTSGNTYMLANLTTGATYEVRLRTSCGTLLSTFYNTLKIATQSCDPPTDFSVIGSLDKLTCSWVAFSPSASYRISWRKDSLAWSNEEVVKGTTYVIPNLVANTKYDVRIRSVCGTTTGGQYSTVSAITAPPPPCPKARNLLLSANKVGEIKAQWRSTPSIVAYRYTWRMKDSTWQPFVKTNDTTFLLKNLDSDTEHEVKIQAICPLNDSGEEYLIGNVSTIPNPICNPPTSLQFLRLGEKYAIVNWKENSPALRYDLAYYCSHRDWKQSEAIAIPHRINEGIVTAFRVRAQCEGKGNFSAYVTKYLMDSIEVDSGDIGINRIKKNELQNTDNQSFKNNELPQNQLLILPNPTHDRIVVHVEIGAAQDATISLMATDGRILSQQTLLQYRRGRFEFDTSLLPNGLYLVRLQTADKTVLVRKVVKL